MTYPNFYYPEDGIMKKAYGDNYKEQDKYDLCPDLPKLESVADGINLYLWK